MVRAWWPTLVGYGLDAAFGERLLPSHPVAYAGTALGALEKWCYRDRRSAGMWYVLGGLSLAEVATRLVPSRLVATYVSVAHTMLLSESKAVEDHLVAGELDDARSRLRSLVGRDAALLDEAGISRAVIESVAENTVDAVVAPLFWGALFGARGTYWYRMINTMDSQVGYRNERFRRFGTAAARLDDVANYLPARLVVVLVMVVRPRKIGRVIDAVRRDAPQHPSPNAGVAEASFAGALGVTLGGTNTYGGVSEPRGNLGVGPAPTASQIAEARRLSRRVGLAALVGLVLFERYVVRRWGAR
ncbi:MAG: adenosylcobinamide-phosphate synthase CbiB [Acidimicrobiales bacterium]